MSNTGSGFGSRVEGVGVRIVRVYCLDDDCAAVDREGEAHLG